MGVPIMNERCSPILTDEDFPLDVAGGGLDLK